MLSKEQRRRSTIVGAVTAGSEILLKPAFLPYEIIVEIAAWTVDMEELEEIVNECNQVKMDWQDMKDIWNQYEELRLSKYTKLHLSHQQVEHRFLSLPTRWSFYKKEIKDVFGFDEDKYGDATSRKDAVKSAKGLKTELAYGRMSFKEIRGAIQQVNKMKNYCCAYYDNCNCSSK